MSVTWHSFDFATGNRGIEVTTRQLGTVSRVIGEPTTTTLEVLAWDEDKQAPVPGWNAATEPGRAMLVALDDDEQIMWGGFVVKRRDGGSAWQVVDVATSEAYLDRRYTGTLLFPETTQTEIARQLLAAAGETNVDITPSTVLRQRAYHDAEDKRVLSALSELTEVDHGLEFTCELVWANAEHTQLKRVWRVADRLGRESIASFEMPGSIATYEFLEDYTTDRGANVVVATSSGEGSARPASDVKADVRPGWAEFEHRYTPATSVTLLSQLDEHAAQRLRDMVDGLSELTFEAHLSTGPRVGVDFHLGDTVTVKITSPRFPEQVNSDGAVVPGLVTRTRVIGYTANFDSDRLSPVTREA